MEDDEEATAGEAVAVAEGAVVGGQEHPTEELVAEGGSSQQIIDALQRTVHSSWRDVAARSTSLESVLPRYASKFDDAPLQANGSPALG